MLSRSSQDRGPGAPPDDWIAIEEAASYLAIPVRTLYRLAQRDQLPGTKVGRTWRFKRSLLDAHLAGLTGSELSVKRVAPAPQAGVEVAHNPPPSVQEGAALLAEMAGLADLSIGLSRLSDRDAIARFVCERLQQVFSVDAVGYLRRTSERGLDELHLSTSAGRLVATEPVRIPVAASPLLRGLIETAAPLVLDDLPNQVTVTHDVVHRLGLRSGVLAPIQTGHEITGVLILVTATRRRFTPLEVERLVAVAGQMGTALANAHLVAQSERWTEQLEGIEAFARELNRHRDVAQLGEALADGLAAFVEYDALRLYLSDPPGELLDAVTLRANAERYTDETPDNVRLRIGEGIAGAVARDGTPALVDDIDSDPRRAPIAGRGDFAESMLAVPLAFESRTVGVLVLCRLGLGAFSQDDLRVVQIVAAQTSVALINARQFEELALRSGRLERQLVSQRQLLAITERLLKTRDSKLIFDAIADTLSEVVPHDTLTIYLVDAKERRLRPILARDQYAEQILSSSLPLGAGITGSVVASGVAELVNDAIHDPRVVQVPDTPDDEEESIIVVPLHSPSGVIGALNLYRIGRHFEPQDLELAKLFGNHAALAIENAQAHEALLEASRTDPLTGLRHHGAFQDILRDALRAGDGPTGILMIDLDNFKAYNDRYGHQAGDRLLQRLAGRFLSSVRVEDTVSRYGGDEFALVLPGTDETGARTTAEKILARISEVPTGARHVRVGASIGVACSPRDGVEPADLISVADTALYVAKQLGRGRVITAGELPTHIRRFREVLDRTMRDLPGSPERGALDPVDLVRPLHHLLAELAPEVARVASESAELCSRVAPRLGITGAERDALIAAALTSHAGWPASGEPVDTGDGAALITLAHPLLAARLLEPYTRLREVSDIVRHHHECWDGSGYPDGLQGEQLSPPVRLLVAVERFLALRRAGPHGAALGAPDALATIRSEAGSHLAPDAVEALAGVLGEAVAA